AVLEARPHAIRIHGQLRWSDHDRQTRVPAARNLGVEQRIELRKNLGNRGAPLRVMRIPVEKIHLFERELTFGPGLFVHPHLALDLAEGLEQALYQRWTGAVQQS